MSDSDIEMASYPETPPHTTQTIPDSPKTADEGDDDTPHPERALENLSNSASVVLTVHELLHHQLSPSAAASLRRLSTPDNKSLTFLPTELRSAALLRLTRRNPSNDEITTVGFAKGLLPHRGQALAPTSGSVLRDLPPLPRRQVMEQLGQRVEYLQMASQGRSDGPRSLGPRYAVAFSTRATQINSLRRPCKALEEDASPIVLVCHWSGESE
ncbi:hypothetical protein FAGAP_13256 [Fusarium agapanthi]|uniref:Uncharacterized protein n=1 Tax=Fusarium agapanthi TaxID=1803897 RepID=A0A9P5E5W9_9HYPO|nr:hypothetical protein FAGAP_13256 [Fusarium agapanthi]